ncbi:MAG: hypothetical protein IJW73_06880 [Candidatus Gastranaerophilales bacterium]|nr:hypothetical protein [Candidatus Gastranaerophilales bacterium]
MKTQSINFTRQYRRPAYQARPQNRRGASFPDPVDSFNRTKQRNYNKKKPSMIRLKAAAILSAAAVAISGYSGYTIGNNQNEKETYLEGFNAGKEQAYAEMAQEQNVGYIDFSQIENLGGYQLTDLSVEEVQEETTKEISQKIYSLAPDEITELDLVQKPYLFKDESNLPKYFSENGIDRDVLKKAQSNCARVFKSGNYLIISPKQDVTLGEVKRVFGIIDEVIGKEPLNEIDKKTYTEGSNGNMDNAILEKDDAIRIKIYDSEKGHQVGVYTAHKSNKSRQKIADEIIKWANK